MTNRILVISIITFSFLFSCTKDKTTSPTPVDVPIIVTIVPATANISDIITITGTNFGSSQTSSFVSFNSTKATDYTSWSSTSIVVKVPSGATTGKLSVTVGANISNEVDFTVTGTAPGESVTIGTQVWTTRNLDVSTYRNGDPIPQVTDPIEWVSLTTGAWCYYNNDANNGTSYGKIYNWYAVNDSRGLAPSGWHVPTEVEWSTLTTYLGGENIAGGKLKETGTNHWQSPNTGATNESGFSALPGGYRGSNGVFDDVGSYGGWWSSTGYGTSYASVRSLLSPAAGVGRDGISKVNGISVRCVRDN